MMTAKKKDDNKEALVRAWCKSHGDERKASQAIDDSAIDVDGDEDDDDDDHVDEFAAFAAKERSNISDLGIKASEAWITAEINRRWSSYKSDIDSSPLRNGSKVNVKKSPAKKESCETKASDAGDSDSNGIRLVKERIPDGALEALKLQFVCEIKGQFMYKDIPTDKMEEESVAKEHEASVGGSSSKKGSPGKSAMSKKPSETKKNGKVPIESGKSSKGITKGKKASARPNVLTTSQRGAELWSQISTGRLVMKCTGSDEKRAWVQQGLELFGVEISDEQKEATEMREDYLECIELARQLHYETEDEGEGAAAAAEDDMDDDDE